MWSCNKKIDLLVNVLIFLVAINFFHYGQLILPIICLILFIDNSFKFNINNLKVFILLILFGITFFAFSYKTGLFSVMGLCAPMAYYIGSNIKDVNPKNIKKIVYIIALGMVCHVLLNMVYSYRLIGSDILTTQGHYDIWLGSKVADTATAVNYVFIIGCMQYILFHEENIFVKIIGTILFMAVMAYDMFLGRRTPILMFGIVFVFDILLDFIYYENTKQKRNKLFKFIIGVLGLVFLLVCAYNSLPNRYDRMIIHYSTLLSKFRREGLSSGRLEVFVESIKLAPKHIWGGQYIFAELGVSPHDLLLDVYDYAGIIPFVLLLVYVIYSIKVCINFIKNKELSNNYKILFISLFMTIGMQLCLEPIMTGSSNFLMIVVVLISIIEKAVLSERKY